MPFGKKKSPYKAVLLKRKEHGYVEEDSFFLSVADMSKETFTHKGRSFFTKVECELYTDMKGVTFLFYDAETGDMINFKTAKSLISPEELDDILEKNILGSLARSVREALTGAGSGWLYPIIIGIVLGGFIGYFVGIHYGAQTVYVPVNQTSTNPTIHFILKFLELIK